MNVYEIIVLAATVLAILVLFGIVAYQNHVEKRDRMGSAVNVQERLEALNRKREGPR